MSSFFQEDDDLGFWETMGQEPAESPEAEAAPEEGTPAETEVVEEAPAVEGEAPEVDTVAETEEAKAERARDEKGRFAKAEPEPDVTRLQEELASLQKRLADKDEFNGRLTNELGELRQLVEKQVSRSQAPSSWDDLVEENPAHALELAYQQQDELNMRRAALALEDVSPGYLALWSQNKQMEQKLAEIEQRTQPVLQQSQEQARNQQKAAAFLAVKSRNPEIEEFIPAIQEIAAKYPSLVTAIESGTPDEVESSWEALLALAKAGKSDTLRAQVERNAIEGEKRVREEAAVASATTVPGEKAKTLADRIGDEWDEIESPLAAGWNI